MSNFCQVIKLNGCPCNNYARKNKECCYSHRRFEIGEIVLEKPKKIPVVQGTPDKCWDDLCKLQPYAQRCSKNNKRYCCWKHNK